MRWATRYLTRKLIWIAVGGAFFGWLYGGGIEKIADRIGVSEVVGKIGEIGDDTPANAANAKTQTAVVSRVVDGDTIEVAFPNGTSADVRLLAYDTPEPYRYGTPECGSKRASAFTTRIAQGKKVKLTADPTQDKVDRYGRLLRYARIDGKDVGRRVVAAGWGAPYVFNQDSPPKNIGYYRTAAANAKAAGRGVWTLCDGNFHSEADYPWSGD